MENELITEVTGYESHAISEFQAMGWIDENGNYDDDLQELVCKNTLELLGLLSKHGYSDASVGYALNLFQKLATFNVLGPLTGEGDEWRETQTPHFLQNRRCSHVFKRRGTAYNGKVRIFRYGDEGAEFSAAPYGREYIYKFPYAVPKVEVITLPIEFKDPGIEKIPDAVWEELGIRIARDAEGDER